jgi:hypothetical protein
MELEGLCLQVFSKGHFDVITRAVIAETVQNMCSLLTNVVVPCRNETLRILMFFRVQNVVSLRFGA